MLHCLYICGCREAGIETRLDLPDEKSEDVGCCFTVVRFVADGKIVCNSVAILKFFRTLLQMAKQILITSPNFEHHYSLCLSYLPCNLNQDIIFRILWFMGVHEIQVL